MHQSEPCRIDLVVGTRPNIVKLAPLARALSTAGWCSPRVVFLEQHSAIELGDRVMDDLEVDISLLRRISLSSRDYGTRLGEMVAAYDLQLRRERPHIVVVFGDVDATLSAALAAKRLDLPVAHVEAGLRSHDRRMPEELNRLMVDSIADLFFATTEDAVDTLVRQEGKPRVAVHFVGNLMIDSLVATVDSNRGLDVCRALDVEPGNFSVATFHRPSNVDDAASLTELVSLLEAAAARLPVLLPLHPRAAASLARHGLRAKLDAMHGLRVLTPMGYRDFISLVSLARVVFTDSGGLQEETTYLGVPCLTVRENTERPVTVSLGTNRLASPANAVDMLDEVLNIPVKATPPIPLWDGRAALRITKVLEDWWNQQAAPRRD